MSIAVANLGGEGVDQSRTGAKDGRERPRGAAPGEHEEGRVSGERERTG